MRVVIVGAGIVGSIYGWAPADNGNQVVHLVRSGRAAALRDGLTLDVFDRCKRRKRSYRGLYKLKVVETLSPQDTFELIIVPTKHYALVQTLEEIAPQAGATDFLLLTQNWLGTQEIYSILPPSRYVCGDAKAGGTFSAGKLFATLSAIDIGSPEDEPTPLAKKAAALFAGAGMQAPLHSDMLHYLWIQYAITAGLWAALVHAGSFEAILNDRNAGSAAFLAAHECLEVVKARGVELSQYPEAAPFQTNSALRRRVYLWLMGWAFRHDEYTKRCSAHAFGDPVEVKTLYDDLIATGRDLGVPMPVMESYAERIRCFAVPPHKAKAL
jgi:2-dehydropantoate 2-reductase